MLTEVNNSKAVVIPLVVTIAAVLASLTQAAEPVIHAAWGEAGAPVLDFDYVVETAPPATADHPDVKLLTGSLTWRVWSTDVDNPSGIGDIGVISSPAAHNYGVSIEDDLGNPGARHVKGIVLDPTSGSNFSRITGGRITGDLEGNLFVQADTTGAGGEVNFTIDGEVIGDLTVPVVSSLSVGSDVLGSISVTDRVEGTFQVDGDVGTVSITINDAVSGSFLDFNASGEPGVPSFAGTLVLTNGIGPNVLDDAGSGALPSGGEGLICTLPTDGCGDLALELLVFYVDERQQVTYEARARASLTVQE